MKNKGDIAESIVQGVRCRQWYWKFYTTISWPGGTVISEEYLVQGAVIMITTRRPFKDRKHFKVFWGSCYKQSTIPHNLEKTRHKVLDLRKNTTRGRPSKSASIGWNTEYNTFFKEQRCWLTLLEITYACMRAHSKCLPISSTDDTELWHFESRIASENKLPDRL